jgi:P27 family predicted phage terminase small subunit
MNEKIAKGTFRPERQKKIPKPDARLPVPPLYLNKEEKSVFRLFVRRISDITVASITHTEMIAKLAIREVEIRKLSKFLNEFGYTYEVKDVVWRGKGEERRQEVVILGIKTRPEVKHRHDAMKHFHSLCLEFGLTASSLGRVAAKDKGKKEENEFSDF